MRALCPATPAHFPASTAAQRGGPDSRLEIPADFRQPGDYRRSRSVPSPAGRVGFGRLWRGLGAGRVDGPVGSWVFYGRWANARVVGVAWWGHGLEIDVSVVKSDRGSGGVEVGVPGLRQRLDPGHRR